MIWGTITAETAVLLHDGRSDNPMRFLRLPGGAASIPGSSLKGMIRSVVETVGPGCWWRSDEGQGAGAIPRDFRSCADRSALCPACRLFGFLGAGSDASALLGAAAFLDAIAQQEVRLEPVWVGPFGSPKPQRRAWYFPNGAVAGRKFYCHHVPTFLRSDPGRGKRLEPLGAGSSFRFSARFDNVAEDDWALLLSALVLEPALRHKLGYGKPAGLGSVRIEIDRIEFLPPPGSDGRSQRLLEGDALRQYLDQQTEAFRRRTDPTLTALRRIWGWPPAAGVTYRYPSLQWFRANPAAPLSATR
ncbi:MAG: RAMP superfamily CRISPR-associated protein [Chloroflexota bacterium]|nr:RAMP superfamily CRISPR-associated protein [Dehalococcoidia bacterium]MDW8252607.1 RAMP superfamily CRISPR-associated protein [Chloroflexota bacterium]